MPLLDGVPPPGAVTAGLRTEHLHIQSAPDGPGQVIRAERLGEQTHWHVALDKHRLVTLTPNATPLAPGTAVRVTGDQALFFGVDGCRIGMDGTAA